MEVNLQIKTTRGFHKVKRDASGAHTHSHQRWGTQIQPTPTTVRQISKFQKQWMEYLQRSTRQHALERGPRLAQQGRGGRIPRAYTFQMPGTNTRTPWIVRQAERGILPPSRRTSPEPSPVAQPLSHMACKCGTSCLVCFKLCLSFINIIKICTNRSANVLNTWLIANKLKPIFCLLFGNGIFVLSHQF